MLTILDQVVNVQKSLPSEPNHVGRLSPPAAAELIKSDRERCPDRVYSLQMHLPLANQGIIGRSNVKRGCAIVADISLEYSELSVDSL